MILLGKNKQQFVKIIDKVATGAFLFDNFVYTFNTDATLKS